MISTNLLDNDSAAEGLPMRLVVTVILLSVIIGLSAKAATLFIDDANEKKLKGQLDLIDKRASVLYIQGGAQDIDDPADFSGTMENIHVEIPDNTAFVVFGTMPSPDGNPPGAGNLHTDNVFYFIAKPDNLKSINQLLEQIRIKRSNIDFYFIQTGSRGEQYPTLQG